MISIVSKMKRMLVAFFYGCLFSDSMWVSLRTSLLRAPRGDYRPSFEIFSFFMESSMDFSRIHGPSFKLKTQHGTQCTLSISGSVINTVILLKTSVILFQECTGWFFFNSPPHSVPKLKNPNEPTRASLPWNPSSKSASGWLISLVLFWYWTWGGG